MTETAMCRNCGVERPLAELRKVGIGRYRKWTWLWSCCNRHRCSKAQQALAAEREKARRALESEWDDV